MISTSEFKNGVTIFVEGEPYRVVWFQHHKPGKGGAVMRSKLKHLKNGSIVEKTFKSGEKFSEVDVTRRKKQFMYSDTDSCHFMDMENYEQIALSKEKLGEQAVYLTENMEVTAMYVEEELVDIELPINVALKVTSTETGLKGDTVSGSLKPATLETGAVVRVPLFIKQGDVIKIDTRTNEYVERV